jgi:dTDP-4-amino-4,6-dideoxygalactose transaminase/CelD/BcsL family acetyltransferase involved in cellulose biosynthesis
MAQRMSFPRLDVWPPLSPGIYRRAPADKLPFPLDEPGCALFERGRHALWNGLLRLGFRTGDQVLVPAYHHGSEVEALRSAGLTCRFYDAREDLAPADAELDELLTPATRALYLIHYLGFAQDAPRWRRWCDERGLLLIEDAAQSWLGSIHARPLGSFGDLAIFCLYKTFGLPDGGALLTAVPDVLSDGRSPAGAVRLAGRHAAWLVQRSRQAAALASILERPAAYSAEKDFEIGNTGSRPSAATLFLLPRVDSEAAARRRLHYRLLLEELGELVPAPFDRLGDGDSPFALPVMAQRKRCLLERLEHHGVRGLDFWSTAHPVLPAARFPGASARRTHLVALPVHQELTTRDVERVASAVRRPVREAVRLEPIESLELVRDDCAELAGASRNIFATWDWVSIWWRHFGAGRPLLLAGGRDGDGRLVAILPLYRSLTRPLRIIRFLGHGPADQLGPICAPAQRRVAARLLRRLLAEQRGSWDLFVGEDLPGDEGWDTLLRGRVLKREGSPVLRTSGGWERFLESRSANLRQQVRRRERNIARKHELRYRLAQDPDRLQADLDILFQLHSAQRDAHESPFAGEHQPFHRDFAARALERGWLRLWFLELDGVPRAAWYGFRFEGVESYYQAGRDMACGEESVGFVLLAHTIRAALDDGITEYRFLRGDEPFKYRFADGDPGLATLAIARGPLGAAAVSAAASRSGRALVKTARKHLQW